MPCFTRAKKGLPTELMTMPTEYFFCDMESARAEPFTSYSFSRMIFLMRASSSLLTLPRPFMTRSTVPREVPASFAISVIVMVCLPRRRRL